MESINCLLTTTTITTTYHHHQHWWLHMTPALACPSLGIQQDQSGLSILPPDTGRQKELRELRGLERPYSPQLRENVPVA